MGILDGGDPYSDSSQPPPPGAEAQIAPAGMAENAWKGWTPTPSPHELDTTRRVSELESAPSYKGSVPSYRGRAELSG